MLACPRSTESQCSSQRGGAEHEGGTGLCVVRSSPGEDPDHCCRDMSYRPSGGISGDTTTSIYHPVHDPRVSSPSPKHMDATLHVHTSAQWTKRQFGGKGSQNNILLDICKGSKPGDFTHCLSLTQPLSNCIRTHHIIPHPGKCEPTVLVVK